MDENPTKEYTGVWIPKEVMECPDLAPIEKILYGEIAGFMVCKASNAWLGKRIGKSEQTASRIINHLIALGFLEYVGFNGRFRQVRVVKNFKPSQKRLGSLVKNEEAASSKMTNIIIKNNNKEEYIRKKESKGLVSYDSVFELKNVSEELKTAFVELIKSRKLNKNTMTNKALELAIDKVRKMTKDEKTQIAIINQSIERGWKGLFPLQKDSEVSASSEMELTTIPVNETKMIQFWNHWLGVSMPLTADNVEALGRLVKVEGEETVKRLIYALHMRARHGYLPAQLRNISNPVELERNKTLVLAFYQKNCKEWERWQENEMQGKPIYMI